MSLTLESSDRELNTSLLQQQLSTEHQYYPTFLTMLVADADGYITHASPAAFRGRGFGDAALVAISAPIHAGETSKAPASPIGILQGSLDLTRLGDFNQRADASSSSLFVIIDQYDTIVYAAPALQLPRLRC
ncbi:MAG: hypothetical protein ACI9YR_000998 [Bacteroidia bacterium]|jgi:hypothetical protein